MGIGSILFVQSQREKVRRYSQSVFLLLIVFMATNKHLVMFPFLQDCCSFGSCYFFRRFRTCSLIISISSRLLIQVLQTSIAPNALSHPSIFSSDLVASFVILILSTLFRVSLDQPSCRSLWPVGDQISPISPFSCPVGFQFYARRGRQVLRRFLLCPLI